MLNNKPVFKVILQGKIGSSTSIYVNKEWIRSGTTSLRHVFVSESVINRVEKVLGLRNEYRGYVQVIGIKDKSTYFLCPNKSNLDARPKYFDSVNKLDLFFREADRFGLRPSPWTRFEGDCK